MGPAKINILGHNTFRQAPFRKADNFNYFKIYKHYSENLNL
jgi:hypothetical protein